MKASQALEARVTHLLAVPNHYLAVRLTVPGLHADEPVEEVFRVVSLAGIPAVAHLVGRWEEAREVRIVSGGRALEWASGESIPARWLLLSPLSRPVGPEAFLALTAPVRRRRRTMH